MSWKLFSMLFVVVAFFGLVVWVYLPRNKERLDSYGSIPLEQEQDSGAHAEQGITEKRP